ncbi:MAG: hypothetical protein IKG95_04980 [Bacteroidales bacterium]|nr:hypothetical protein [Bacteroidales bacterium]
MTDNKKALFHHFEMASHSEGYAQFLYQLMGGGFITKDQARETMEFFIAKMKRDIESNPNLSREQKDHEISMRESWFNTLKASMGL